MAKAPRSGRVLNNADAAVIKSMINRSDRQHDIAAYFAVNGGRIGEISRGATFPGVQPANGPLPPAPPYLVVPANLRADADALRAALVQLNAPPAALARVDRIIDAMEASRQARHGV